MKYYSIVLNDWVSEEHLIERTVYPKDGLIPGLSIEACPRLKTEDIPTTSRL